MRKKLSKRVGCLIAVLCLVILECSAVSARELPVAVIQNTDLANLSQYDTNGDGFVTAIIIGSEPNQATSDSGIQLMSIVVENGVRLRSAPNSSATILELMYVNEAVTVNLNASCTGTGWYYLLRHKTGTWGYASSSYILVK